MKLKVNEQVFLSPIEPHDKSAYLEHFKVKQIADQTLQIPHPYTEQDADGWIRHTKEETNRQGQPVNWAIRRSDGFLIGGFGFHDLQVGKSHRSEIGYWLAKSFWNQGIMTAVVKVMTDHGFKKLGLVRITAMVFDFNLGSARVLEKAGYQREGILKKYYKKNDKIFDGLLYAKTV